MNVRNFRQWTWALIALMVLTACATPSDRAQSGGVDASSQREAVRGAPKILTIAVAAGPMEAASVR
jgi:hypothetical protein